MQTFLSSKFLSIESSHVHVFPNVILCSFESGFLSVFVKWKLEGPRHTSRIYSCVVFLSAFEAQTSLSFRVFPPKSTVQDIMEHTFLGSKWGRKNKIHQVKLSYMLNALKTKVFKKRSYFLLCS